MSQVANDIYKTGLMMVIYPNALGFAYAIMKDALSVEVTQIVHEKKKPIENERLIEKLRRKIAFYEPDKIVIPNYKGWDRSKRVDAFIKLVIEFASKRGIPFFTYTRDSIRFTFNQFNAHTKHEIAQVIARNIPYMKTKLYTRRRCYDPEPYHAGMFDAVSLGVTHFYMTD